MPQDYLPRSQSSLGQRLRDVRERAGLSQQSLAEKVGMSASGIARIEAGRSTPYPKTQLALSKALRIDRDWLLYGTHVPNFPVARPDEHHPAESSAATTEPAVPEGLALDRFFGYLEQILTAQVGSEIQYRSLRESVEGVRAEIAALREDVRASNEARSRG